jgi:hypothetical protein
MKGEVLTPVRASGGGAGTPPGGLEQWRTKGGSLAGRGEQGAEDPDTH